ncbi:hypothetical protein CUZ56_01722 [Saezia sanguinis]|uniref:Uncharacterized protein n=1 Tax=Saezia sanguinis TaxID=1965230 RepID=A0A433SCH3_9BURK|nr:hypothetical protein CUZ56_01722 [Saezia sanguinis]
MMLLKQASLRGCLFVKQLSASFVYVSNGLFMLLQVLALRAR